MNYSKNARAALISVSDKTGLIEFSKSLIDLGFILLATSGSKKILEESGIKAESIELYTEQKEILGGRVKTLHPKIHAGLLAKRDDASHLAQLEEQQILPIDVAVINLYPFGNGLKSDTATNPAKMIELIDVGGPTMIRASAKNFTGVLPVLDPTDYSEVIELLTIHKEVKNIPLDFRRKLSKKVFTFTANYDLQIAKYLSHVSFEGINLISEGKVDVSTSFELGDVSGIVLTENQSLRYGENPHQNARLYESVDKVYTKDFEQLHGKELSYNNLLDFDAALSMIQSFPASSNGAVIIKHLNPCGAAFSNSISKAVENAKKCDPRSHFGGVIATNKTITADAALGIAGDFAEIVIAPDYEPEALTILQKSKNLRILKTSLSKKSNYEFRSTKAGFLIQTIDPGSSPIADAKVVSKRAPTSNEIQDLEFAWTICAHVKSNAIVLSKDQLLVGVGAGQMSRVDSSELAVSKAKTHGHLLTGASAASDAFFPFPDGIEYLASQGVTAVVSPGGAKRDPEVIQAADRLGIALLFVEDRHFRH